MIKLHIQSLEAFAALIIQQVHLNSNIKMQVLVDLLH